MEERCFQSLRSLSSGRFKFAGFEVDLLNKILKHDNLKTASLMLGNEKAE